MTISFKQAIERLNDFTNYEKETPKSTREFGIDPIKKLLAKLKDPCHHTPIIHIAGTKGKGSTSWYAGALVHATGVKVGVFSSPHLISITERITVNGIPISEERFAKIADQVVDAAEDVEAEHKVKPTWFDLLTAIAMCYFHEEEVPIVVLEVGLGGRLDSTNFCAPAVTVITRIDFDHMQVLGTTLSAIAMEKGGIIKKKVPVVTVSQDPEVMQVLEKLADINEAPLKVLGRDINLSDDGKGMDLDTGTEYFTALVKKAHGHFQWENAAIAVAAVEIVAKKIGMKFGEQDVRFALLQTEVPARMQELGDMFVDCAHNPISMRALAQTLGELEYSDMRVIVGMARDKLVDESLKILSKVAKQIWCVPIPSKRSSDPKELKTVLEKLNPNLDVFTCESFKEALDVARTHESNDPILVTGSVYLAGEALKENVASGQGMKVRSEDNSQ